MCDVQVKCFCDTGSQFLMKKFVKPFWGFCILFHRTAFSLIFIMQLVTISPSGLEKERERGLGKAERSQEFEVLTATILLQKLLQKQKCRRKQKAIAQPWVITTVFSMSKTFMHRCIICGGFFWMGISKQKFMIASRQWKVILITWYKVRVIKG